MIEIIDKYISLIEGYPTVPSEILSRTELLRILSCRYYDDINRGQSGLNYVERELKKMWEDIDKK